MQQFLMCRPDHFDVNYVINPWMEYQLHQADCQRAIAQWEAYYRLLSQYASVQLFEPVVDLPDIIFTANAGLVYQHNVILSNFFNHERRPEESFYADWFERAGYQLYHLPNQVTFEGAGDALFQPGRKRLWLGYGIRSMKKAQRYLEALLYMECFALELVDPRFYHLDTCFCPLLDNEILYYPKAFSKAAQDLIIQHSDEAKRIILCEQDAWQFAANAVLVKSHDAHYKGTIVLNAATDKLKQTLRVRGYQVIIAPVNEFIKAGGANRCLTLAI